MENILNLVRSMQTGEIKLLRHFYRFLEDNDLKKINLLFDLSVKWKNSKKTEGIDKKIQNELYCNNIPQNEQTFIKLKARLKNDILNILLFQTSSPKFKTRHELAIFECGRLLLQAEILLSRGIYDESMNILERASALAHKNELFGELMLIDGLCRNYNLLRAGERSIAFMQKIEGNTVTLEKLQTAKHFHYELMAVRAGADYHLHSPEEWCHKLECIKNDHERSKSVKIGFYYFLCALSVHRELHDFERSAGFGRELLQYAKKHEILKADQYAAAIHIEVSRCYLLSLAYEDAIHHAEAARMYFEKDPMNALAALEIIFFCALAVQDYKNVYLSLENVFPKLNRQSDEFSYAKWHFYKAGVEFRMNEHRNALQSLRKCDELMKDKNGWLLAYNLFEVMCRIENGHLEWFEDRSEALRKMMQRYNKSHSGNQNKRFSLIYHILKTLHKNSYDYVLTIAEERLNMQQLSDIGYTQLWHLNGFEPVQFDAWMISKADNQGRNKKSKPKLVA